MRWNSWIPRFSIRAMLVGLTLIGFGLAWVASERRQSQREQEIARHFQTSSRAPEHSVWFGGPWDPPHFFPADPEPAAWRATARRILGDRVKGLNAYRAWSATDRSLLAQLTSVHSLTVYQCSTNDLLTVAQLKSLRRLAIEAGTLTDISPLMQLTQLHQLSVDTEAEIDVAPLVTLTSLKSLRVTRNSPLALNSLTHLTNLEDLSLGEPVADIHLLPLLKNLARLQLAIRPDADLSPLLALPKLTWLSIATSHLADITPLTRLNGLVQLTINAGDSTLSDEQFSLLRASRPDCNLTIHGGMIVDH